MKTDQKTDLIGVWTGCAFPTQETTVVFCEDGSGLYFYYQGSLEGSICR